MFLVVIALVLLVSAAAQAENTGGIIIQKQNVELYLQENTDVLIHYDDVIQVTSGDCPWITMGLPNQNFNVVNIGGAASSVVPQNSAGWSGVYVTLDKDYKPGQTFEFQFTVDQHNFVTLNDKGMASVEIIPVWFDDTPITAMTVTFHMPPNAHQVTTSNNAAHFLNGIVFWTFANLAPGQQETVGVEMPADGVFTAPAPSATSGGTSSIDSFAGQWGGIIVFGILWIGIMVLGHNNRYGGYQEPQMNLNSALSGKTVHRNLHLKCPNDGVTMDDKTAGNPAGSGFTKYAICPTCGALFFDRGEIEKLLKNEVAGSTLSMGFTGNVSPAPAAVSHGPVTTCERCGGNMEEVRKTFNGTTATLSFCKDCGGLHIQSGEYDKILQIHDGQKMELEDKGTSVRDVPDDHWLFYPNIYYPTITGHVTSGGGGFRGGGGCVGCACAACACACACAGGGHAGCSPKDKFNGICLYDPPQ